jgi:MFS family permease
MKTEAGGNNNEEKIDVKTQEDCENASLLPKNGSTRKIWKEKYLSEIFERMMFTRYHFFLILSIFLIRSIEGTEVLSLSLASTMIEKSFNLNENASQYINGIILSGNFIGCIISMYLSNKFPRKFFISLGATLIILFGFASILVHQIIYFVLFRHIVNIGIGLLFAGSMSLVTESINPNYRGFVLNLILVSGNAGEIFISCSLGSMVDLKNHHEWNKLFLLSITPVKIIFK